MARRQSRVLGDDEEVQLDMTPMLEADPARGRIGQ